MATRQLSTLKVAGSSHRGVKFKPSMAEDDEHPHSYPLGQGLRYCEGSWRKELQSRSAGKSKELLLLNPLSRIPESDKDYDTESKKYTNHERNLVEMAQGDRKQHKRQ